MQLNITIDTGNDAFRGRTGTVGRRILQELIEKTKDTPLADLHDKKIFDINGNAVGGVVMDIDFSGDSTGIGARVFNTAAIAEVVDDGVFLVERDGQGLLFSLSPTNWHVGVANFVFASQLDKPPGPIRAFHRIRGGVVA